MTILGAKINMIAEFSQIVTEFIFWSAEVGCFPS